MLSNLPPEILLNILSFLRIPSIHLLQLVSRDFNNLITSNESSVYHAAAILPHRFIPPGTSFADAKGQHRGQWLDNLKDWKDLCQRWFLLEKNWEGQGSMPRESALMRTGNDVHRFKLDEEYRFVITTHRLGGLLVSSMDDQATIFTLSRGYVRDYSHCEYGQGFVIFGHYDPHSLEVWRLETDLWDLSIPSHPPNRCFPYPRQIAASQSPLICSRNPHRRGNFSPWALLTPPHELRAYRFVYPTLLVASEVGAELYLFDIPTATHTETISLASHPFLLQINDQSCIQYVELGARHVFVCTSRGLLIISRDASEAPRKIMEVPPPEMALRIPELARLSAAQITGRYPHNPAMNGVVLTSPPEMTHSTALVSLGNMLQKFSAVHVSPSGADFVAINRHGIVFLVRDFERVMRGEASFSDITLRIYLNSPAMHLAFEHGRAVAQTTSAIYIINMDATYHAVTDSAKASIIRGNFKSPVLPHLSIHQLTHFTDAQLLSHVHCVQMTKTGVWLGWAPYARDRLAWTSEQNSIFDRSASVTVCCIDFAP